MDNNIFTIFRLYVVFHLLCYALGKVRHVQSFSRVAKLKRITDSIIWEGEVQLRSACFDKCANKFSQCTSLSVQPSQINGVHYCILSYVMPGDISDANTVDDADYDTYTEAPVCSPTNPCSAHGTCQDIGGDVNCACDAGMEGHKCHLEIDECKSSPCVHGDCVDQFDAFSCQCDEGFKGDHCEINIDDCGGHNCTNSGVCVDAVLSYSCNCTGTGYGGDYCEIDIDPCDPPICGNFGECEILSPQNATCHCFVPYGGQFCETQTGSPAMDTENPGTVNNGESSGQWRDRHKCTPGGAVNGYNIRSEDFTSFDWVGIVEINLFCVAPNMAPLNTIQSYRISSLSGNTRTAQTCPPSYYVIGFQQSTASSHGVIHVRLRCRGPGFDGTEEVDIGNIAYPDDGRGTFGPWSATCAQGSAVCATEFRAQGYQGVFSIDRALTDMRMFCCDFVP